MRRQDVLEALARRIAGGPVRKPQADPKSSEELLTRASALKLGAAAAASLVFAQWRVSDARADPSLGDCLAGCVKNNEQWLKKQTEACLDVFVPDHLDSLPTWKVVLAIYYYPPDAVAGSLGTLCIGKAHANASGKDRRCVSNCKKECAASSSNSRSAARRSDECKADPSPPPYTPAPPPAPSYAEDPCWACVEVGGKCCSGFPAGGGTGYEICGCTSGTCADVGC